MIEGSLAFYKLDVTGKEHFYEINNPEFHKIVDHLEHKINTQDNKIQNLENMRENRTASASKYVDELDLFEGKTFDSSMVIGKKVIMRFFKRLKEKRLEKK
jgi:hypothetical protein